MVMAIWLQSVGPLTSRQDFADIAVHPAWKVSSAAARGDVIPFYRTKPDIYIKDIFEITGPAFFGPA